MNNISLILMVKKKELLQQLELKILKFYKNENLLLQLSFMK